MLKNTKSSFTLIELLVTIAIVTTLLTVALPIYDKKVLKSRFDEAKVTIQAIALAQERYKLETGVYYSFDEDTGDIKNEDIISFTLRVDLAKSNNFVYHLVGVDDIDDKQQYLVKAILRHNSWDTNCNSNNDDLCKQDDTIDEDEWTTKYSTGEEKHFIRFRYPTLIKDDESDVTQAENGIDYTNIYTGD
jgi:type IV pilus assembly protein PilE